MPRRRVRTKHTHAAGGRLLAAALVTLTTGSALATPPRATPDTTQAGQIGQIEQATPAADRRREVRRLLEDARRLRREDRLEAALRTTARGLALAPEDVSLLRLRARLLEAVDRGEEAAPLRARADALAPPPADPPDAPLPSVAGRPAGSGLVVIVLPSTGGRRPRADDDETTAPAGLDAILIQRIAQRLPGARITGVPADVEHTVPALATWLEGLGAPGRTASAISLRVERADCLDTIKDGRFGLGILRVGIAGRALAVRTLRDDVLLDPDCPARQVARVLESAFALPEFEAKRAAAVTGTPIRPSRGDIVALFPDLASAVEAELVAGRRALADGELVRARDAFRRATRIDPDHVDARSFLVEVERHLELGDEIAAVAAQTSSREAPASPNGWTRPGRRPTPTEVRILETQLEEAQREREDLLATLALLGAGTTVPGADTLAQLRDAPLPPDDALGVIRARAVIAGTGVDGAPEASRALVARVLADPDGRVRARYYFVAGEVGGAPVLVEEDTRGDAAPDRFVAWRSGRWQALWERNRGGGLPDVSILRSDEGDMIERIELARAEQSDPLRVFVFRDGQLRSDFVDRDGDGRFDEILHFDASGAPTSFERDTDDDGRIDTRSLHRDGRVVRYEILGPGVAVGVP